MRRFSCIPLKDIELASSTLPFKFTIHNGCALFGVQLTAKIMNFEVKSHILNIHLCSFINANSVSIWFYRLKQIVLWYIYENLTLVSSKFRLVKPFFSHKVISHVRLCFSPMHKCLNDSRKWAEIIQKYILEISGPMTEAVTRKMTCNALPEWTVLLDSSNIISFMPPWRSNILNHWFFGLQSNAFNAHSNIRRLHQCCRYCKKVLKINPCPPN